MITEWVIPTVDSQPRGVAVDSSDNVYFTELWGDKIGRLVPSTNVITEWVIPKGMQVAIYPMGVAVDSSDNVYFTEHYENNIGRLS